jgi:formylmethanofuran dehydrogenase subunit E
MQAEKAEQIRMLWGSKKCYHPSFVKLKYFLKEKTNDYVCVQCGNNFSEKEVKEIESKRKNK